MSAAAAGRVVVKLSGSLLDAPALVTTLGTWLDTLDVPRVLLVPGGGPTTDVIRHFDRSHHLGEERAHWLALRALSLNAHAVAALLPASAVVPVYGENVWDDGGPWRVGVVDAFAALAADEGPDALPHAWDAGSDAVAARVARLAGAARLILLKSTDLPAGMSWDECARRGLVDPYFPAELRRNPALRVEAVNLRRWCRPSA